MNPESLAQLADEVRRKLRFKDVCTTICETHGLHAADILVSASEPRNCVLRLTASIGPESVSMYVHLLNENVTANLLASRLLRLLEGIVPTDPTLEELRL